MTEIPVIDRLVADELPRDRLCRFWLRLATDALGGPVLVPVLAMRGEHDGPALGVTAALHGNEVNGIPVVQRLLRGLESRLRRGTVVGVPVLNVPSYHAQERTFPDLADLNRIMPGKPNGGESDVYASRLLDKLLLGFDYLLDLHTASFGRVNTHYVRADLGNPEAAALARLQNAAVIVDTAGEAGTLRPVLAKRGIVAITVELCDPHVFQQDVIDRGVAGLENALVHLGMTDGETRPAAAPAVECRDARWLYTDRGGLLEVFPDLAARVRKGEKIARLTNAFGDLICEYAAPEAGIVIGKSVNPVSPTGGRIVYLGTPR
jgi:predicted deacylase